MDLLLPPKSKTDKETKSQEISFRSSQASIILPNSDDFYEVCRSQLKVSSRNATLQLKIHGHSEVQSLNASNSDQIDELLKKQLEEHRKFKEDSPNDSVEFFNTEVFSIIIFFVVPDNHLKFLVPDYEKYSCRQVFESSESHESFFGLSRLLTYEAKYSTALEYINRALRMKEDSYYNLWQSLLRIKVGKTSEVEPVQVSFFQRLWCYRPAVKRAGVAEELERMNQSVEVLWALLELACKGNVDIDKPEYYASKLKDIDEYYGYLAWAHIYTLRNDPIALSLLKEIILKFGQRPEAYISLWNFYYKTLKDYNQAEDIISEAMLRISPSSYFQYYILLCIYTSKVYFKQKRFKECFGFLQRKFVEHPTYPVFLFMFGKLSTKCEDFGYTGSALSALHEALKLCDTSKSGTIYYWITKAYMLARLHIDASQYAKYALEHLDKRSLSKINELKEFLKDIHPNMTKIHLIEILLSAEASKENFEKCRKLCNEVQGFHKLTADVMLAKALWKNNRQEESLKKLYSVSGISTVKMTAYFVLLEYLKLQDNLKCMKTVACEMIAKCRNPQVPSYVWVKVNLIYSKILIRMRKPGKAILLLKSLAKTLPPFPFVNIQYTKVLQRAKNIQELTEAHSKVIESYNAYTFGTYKNSFIGSFTNSRDFARKLFEEDELQQPEGSSKKFNNRRNNRLATEKIDGALYSKRNQRVAIDEQSKNAMPDIKFRENSDIMMFAVCSDVSFLYKIGKISMRYGVQLIDGVCAIADYIELLKFEKDTIKQEQMMEKALKLQSFLQEKSRIQH